MFAGFAFVHDDNGHDGIEPLGLDRRDVVGDDDLAGGDVVALADVGGEALALQRDGVQARWTSTPTLSGVMTM